jgi:hypothetical protein
MTSLLGSNQMERDPAFARRRAMTSIAGRDAQGRQLGLSRDSSSPNEKEISHGRCRWQDCSRSLYEGAVSNCLGFKHNLDPF